MKEKEEAVEENEPKSLAKPSWIKIKPEELERIVVELAGKGESPAKIGIVLRDQHGIPKTKVLGKRITEILKQKGVALKSQEDIINEKIAELKTHISRNNHDYTATRALTKKLWDLHGLKKAN